MFDSIILRTSEKDGTLSVGRVAEALLYYQKTHLLLSRHTLLGLIDQLGVPTLIELLSRPEVTAEFYDGHTLVLTDDQGTYKERYFLGYGKIVSDQDQIEYASAAEKLEDDLGDKLRSPTEIKKILNFISDKVPFKELTSEPFIQNGTPVPNTLFKSPTHLKALIRESVKHLVGGYLLDENYKFDILPTDDNRHIVFADIDWKRINASRQSINPSLDEVNLISVLTSIHSAHTELILASHYSGDFITTENASNLIRITHAELLKKAQHSSDQISSFKEHVLKGLPDITTLINNRQKSLNDFFKVVDKSNKFKEWLSKSTLDDKIVGEYIQAIRGIDKFESVENKIMRYLIGLWLGVSNPPAGMAVGFFEAFMLEKYAKKWRPNHFIDNSLVPFLSR